MSSEHTPDGGGSKPPPALSKLPDYVRAAMAQPLGDWFPRWFDACDPPAQAAAERLLTDERMRALWTSNLSVDLFLMIVADFEVATARDAWANKTQRERDTWHAKFEKTCDALLELMAEAPIPPGQWGFPAWDTVLMNVFQRAGVPLPDSSSPDFFPRMLALKDAADAERWTIADALQHYRENQRRGVPQRLRKPGDAKAGRAEFIICIHGRGLTATEVATIAQVAFDDESIDDRLVRRLSANRADS